MARITTSLLLATAGLGVSTTSQAAISHDAPIFNPVTGNYYYLLHMQPGDLVSELQPYAVANLSGNLVTINDAAENAWLLSTFGPIANGSSDAVLTIGYNDIATELSFEWFSGEPVTYINWFGGEPNSGGGAFEEDYVAMLDGNGLVLGGAGFWVDYPDGETLGFGFPIFGIVESSIPEPASIALMGLGALLIVGRKHKR